MIVFTFTALGGSTIPFTMAGALTCTSGPPPVVDVTLSGPGGRRVSLVPGSAAAEWLGGAPAGSVPIYDTPDPVTSICGPPQRPTLIPRATSLALAKRYAPSVAIAVPPAPLVADKPVAWQPVPATTLTIGGAAGQPYTFELRVDQ